MTDYGKITPELVDELRDIVGSSYVIYNDPDKLEPYSRDEVADPDYAAMPDVVVKVRRAEEIAAILRLANREKIPVTPRGAGSGLSGGAVPVYGGIVISTERMNSILEIDRDNMMVVVEPGVITNEINNVLREYGLFYAGYPMSLETCYIGGNVAENAGGGRAIKYGVTGRYVHGLQVVLPTGEIVNLGGKRVKDVTGYDLLGLMVGSEGTLGIFTRIVLKLLPLPTEQVALLVPFAGLRPAIAAVPRMMTNGRIIPTAVEFMDRLSVETSCRYLNERIPYDGVEAMLLIELDGSSAAQVEAEAETIGELCLAHGAMEVYVADNHTTRERVWSVRRAVAEAFKVFSPVQSLEDIVVPMAAIPELMEHIAALSAKYDLPIPCYGHAGDGNMHATIVHNPQHPPARWKAVLPLVLQDLYRATSALGGTISGEHGIGHKRRSFMPLVLGTAELALMRRIKQALDPHNILNPGKII